MSTTLSIQILIYMILIGSGTFILGYIKGHRDGSSVGYTRGRQVMRSSLDEFRK